METSVSSKSGSKSRFNLFSTFPREIGFNRTWCETLIDFRNYLEDSNGIKKCSISIYQQTLRDQAKKYGSAIKEGAVIDKIYIDLDGTYSFYCHEILRDWLLENDTSFRLNLSGRKASHDKRAARLFDPDGVLGFHYYIFIENNLKYHSVSLKNAHEFINKMMFKKLEFKYGIKKHKKTYKNVIRNGKEIRLLVPEDELPDDYIYSPIDRTIFGDVSRMSTPTNTLNPKRQCFCQPVLEKELFYDSVQLAKLTKKQRVDLKGDLVIGNNAWNVPMEIQEKDIEIDISKDDREIFDINEDIIDNKAFPKCVKFVLSQEHPDYDARFWLMIYLREYGFTKKEVRNLMQFYIERTTLKHIISEEKTLQYVFDTTQKDRRMINCDHFRQILGFNQLMCQNCRRCKYGNPIYF